MDHIILNHGQVTWTTPDLAPLFPNYHTTPWEDVLALDRFNVHRCLTRRNLGGRTGKILRPSSVALKSKNQEINRLQLAVKLPWAIFFESVDILS
ncbi:hypothetical protein TNCV_4548381 [Trichonephila clavipes]|nr:hypothetical protein TNCV_4548381 [Trichonephila clavipes]